MTPTILQEIAAHKRQEVEARKALDPLNNFKDQLGKSDRDFKGALVNEGMSLIAEVKQASPSEGVIAIGGFDPVQIALEYEEAGASAISVLTDKKYFSGDHRYLHDVSEAVQLPVLCKDFVVDEYQIYEARKFGADAVLLIAGILSIDQMESFLAVARSLAMDAICEVHNEEELNNVLHTSADIIGINNRNLHTFETDLKTTESLIGKIPEEKVIVSESGIYTRADVESLPERVGALLVGTSLMKSGDVNGKINELIG